MPRDNNTVSMPERPLLASSGVRVLLADDSSFGQAVGRRVLEDLGCVVDVVANGGEAFARACAHSYDVVFMDCHMPGIDGYEASRRIRLVPRLASLPIIALTAETGPQARQRCLEAGATGYLQKPYRREMMAAVLEGALTAASVGATP
jgi:CheY-like chemotaxis protein